MEVYEHLKPIIEEGGRQHHFQQQQLLNEQHQQQMINQNDINNLMHQQQQLEHQQEYQHHLNSQISPPRELTEPSIQSSSTKKPANRAMIVLSSPNQGPMQYASRQQALQPMSSGQKRSRQVFDSARPHQVYIPQQTESDDLLPADELELEEENMTPMALDDEDDHRNNRKHQQLSSSGGGHQAAQQQVLTVQSLDLGTEVSAITQQQNNHEGEAITAAACGSTVDQHLQIIEMQQNEEQTGIDGDAAPSIYSDNQQNQQPYNVQSQRIATQPHAVSRQKTLEGATSQTGPSDQSIGDEAHKTQQQITIRQQQTSQTPCSSQPIQLPSPQTRQSQQSQQYSPTLKSEKSPLGFTATDQRSQSYSQMETMKSMDRSQMIGDEYCLLKDLGEGTFGNVKLGKHLSSGQLVAVKILEKKRITDQADVERVIREIKILKSIRHPHIIKLYEIIETKARIFLIMEYACGGELFDYIVRKDRLPEKEACRFYNQIVSGIEFLHSKGIAHRDLKPENLLLDKQKNLKIVDFGLSNTYKTGQTLKTACGSPCYAAPEMIAGKRYNGIEVDIWSSGVTLYAMLCGFLPFEDPDTALLYKKILKGDFELPDFLTNRSIKFLKELLCTDPSRRLILRQIKVHPWFTQFDPKAIQHLERTGDNSRLMLSTAVEENKNFNTQLYGHTKGNSSLVAGVCTNINDNTELPQNSQQSPTILLQSTLKPACGIAATASSGSATTAKEPQEQHQTQQHLHHEVTTGQHHHRSTITAKTQKHVTTTQFNNYFSCQQQQNNNSNNNNQTTSISSSMTATVTKPGKTHQKSISETHMPSGATPSHSIKKQQQQQHNYGEGGATDSQSTIHGGSQILQHHHQQQQQTHQQQIQQHHNNRPSTSLRKATTNSKASKSQHNVVVSTSSATGGVGGGSSVTHHHHHHHGGKRPKQQTTLSAIISSPRNKTTTGVSSSAIGTNSVSASLKARVDEQINSYHTKSERKPTANQNLKDKLRTLKINSGNTNGNAKIDSILLAQQQQSKQTIANTNTAAQSSSSTAKARAQKVPTALSLLNNTMPMPKLKIDLASPSTGGSTDLGVYATSANKNSGIASKDVFKNNLARVAKNSAAAAQLHMQQQVLLHQQHTSHKLQTQIQQPTAGGSSSKDQNHGMNSKTLTAGTKKHSVSLKKQMLNQHVLNQQLMAAAAASTANGVNGAQSAQQNFVTQSRSAIGGGSAHSSLSNKRKKKSERGVSHNSCSSSTPAVNNHNNRNISQSASKAKQFPSKPGRTSGNVLKTLSFERNGGGSKAGRGGGKHHHNAAAMLSSVHPYTVMAMPLHSISQNNLKENVLSKIGGGAPGNTSSAAAIATKKSSNRHSIASNNNDPSSASLTKMPKNFVKSHQTLQTQHQNNNGSSTQFRTSQIMQAQPRAHLQRHPTQKLTTSSSIETQLRNVKIAFNSKKASNNLNNNQMSGIECYTSGTVYSKVVAQEAQKIQQKQNRQASSLETLKKTRNASCDMIMLQTMRVCSQSCVSPDWCSTEPPQKIIETLEALLPLLNVQFIHRKSTYHYSLKIASRSSSNQAHQQRITARPQTALKIELELMQLKNAPFVTVVRLTQKVKLKQSTTASTFIESTLEKEIKLAQFQEFCRQLKQGLNL